MMQVGHVQFKHAILGHARKRRSPNFSLVFQFRQVREKMAETKEVKCLLLGKLRREEWK